MTFMSSTTTTTRMNQNTTASLLEERAAAIFVQQGLCASADEATDVLRGMESLLLQSNNTTTNGNALLLQDRQTFVEAALCCFDVSASQLEAMFDAIQIDNNSDNEDDDDEEENDALLTQDNDDEDDDDYIGEGECELCERQVQLTRHHLIPRSTWPRLEARLLHAMEALVVRGDRERAVDICGPGLEHLLIMPEVKNNANNADDDTDDATAWFDRAAQRQFVRNGLQRVCLICRPCHSAVHRTHDNMTLALSYNTVEKLVQDAAIYKFAKWASTQRPKGIR